MAAESLGEILRDPSFYALVLVLASAVWGVGALLWLLIQRRLRRRRRRRASHYRGH